MDGEEELEGMPPQYQNLVRVIGTDAAACLCREYGGEVIYIPKLDRVEAARQRDRIRREWNGRNSVQLARKYGKSVRWIQKTVESMPETKIPGQLSIDDVLK